MIDKSLITVELVIVASIVATWSIVSFQCRYLFCICKKLLAAWQVRYNHLNFSNFLGINYIYFFLIGVGSAVRCFEFFVMGGGGMLVILPFLGVRLRGRTASRIFWCRWDSLISRFLCFHYVSLYNIWGT